MVLDRVRWATAGTLTDMKLLRTAAAAGIAKRLYTEARKPHNQAKIKAYVQQAMDKKKGSRGGSAGRRPY